MITWPFGAALAALFAHGSMPGADGWHKCNLLRAFGTV
jgi:hypothetical protein